MAQGNGAGPDASPEVPLRIGLFGGTFDPPHVGHTTVASDVADVLELDTLFWIPAGDPPHKSRANLTPAPLRLEMVRAATNSDPRFATSAIEIRREGASYTVDTVREIGEAFPAAELFLIIGADQFAAFGSWRSPAEILSMATLAVMDRDGVDASTNLPDVPGVEHARFVEVTRVDVSSTSIRGQVAAGELDEGLLPTAVADFIRAEGLYRG